MSVSDEMHPFLAREADQEIAALESRVRAAQLDADVAALDALIGDELLFTGPDGRLGTKAQDLEVHGQVVRGTYRYTVWAREGGGPWRVVAGHVSEVPAERVA